MSLTVDPKQPREEQIRQRAYEIYLARGCEDGHDREDWIEADRELKGLTGCSDEIIDATISR